jgi:hypothetical protein
MGRMYYANAKLTDPRIIRMLTTRRGTVVLAMRAPDVGERGYAIGVDFTVMNAVNELLNDWHPGEEPGWVAQLHGGGRPKMHSTEQTYDVTILAAYQLDDHEIPELEEDEPLEKCPGVCGKPTDGESFPCGECFNCHAPPCIHGISDQKWREIREIFDPPCDRWKLKADGKTFDAAATHGETKCDKCGDESNSEPNEPCGRSLGLDKAGEETMGPYCDGTYRSQS